MDTAFPPAPIHSDWKILYRAAILEPDKKVLRQKVREAEAAVVARGRELFYAEVVRAMRRKPWKTRCTFCARIATRGTTRNLRPRSRPQKPPHNFLRTRTQTRQHLAGSLRFA